MVMESMFYFYPDVRDIATGIALSGTGKIVFIYDFLNFDDTDKCELSFVFADQDSQVVSSYGHTSVAITI